MMNFLTKNFNKNLKHIAAMIFSFIEISIGLLYTVTCSIKNNFFNQGVYIFIFQLSSFDDSNDTMKVLVDLIDKVKKLEQNMSEQMGLLNQQLSATQQNIENNARDIVHTQTNTSSAISYLNMTLQLQLYNISKQVGPQVTTQQNIEHFGFSVPKF